MDKVIDLNELGESKSSHDLEDYIVEFYKKYGDGEDAKTQVDNDMYNLVADGKSLLTLLEIKADTLDKADKYKYRLRDASNAMANVVEEYFRMSRLIKSMINDLANEKQNKEKE